MSSLPEITEVKRLTLRPGDAVVVRVDREPTDQEACTLAERLRAVLGEGVPVVILAPWMDLEVASLGGADFVKWLTAQVRTHGGDPEMFSRKVAFR